MIDKMMNCTAGERWDLAGRVYGDYISFIERGIGDDIADLTRRNI